LIFCHLGWPSPALTSVPCRTLINLNPFLCHGLRIRLTEPPPMPKSPSHTRPNFTLFSLPTAGAVGFWHSPASRPAEGPGRFPGRVWPGPGAPQKRGWWVPNLGQCQPEPSHGPGKGHSWGPPSRRDLRGPGVLLGHGTGSFG